MNKEFRRVVCLYCGEDLSRTINRQWVHKDGNVYYCGCIKCGWLGTTAPTAGICPNCGSKSMRGHFAYPDLTDEEKEKL